MTKIIRIEKCGECPYFGDECEHPQIKEWHVGFNNSVYFDDEPPEWCPLDDEGDKKEGGE